MRCPRCGNENSEDNRFCGMCGTKLVSPPLAVAVPTQSTTLRTSASPSSVAPSSAAPIAQPPIQSVPRSAAPPLREDSPGISGPSFLGLNDPPPRQRASLSADRHSGSDNLDYLLEDDEPKRSGGGKFVLILFALALAVLFGYLRFKVLKERPGKAPAAPVTDSSSATPPAVSTDPASTPAQPAAPAAQPAGDSSASSSPPAAAPATTDAGGTPAANAPPVAAPPAQPAKDNSTPSQPAKEDAPADGSASNSPTNSAPADAATKTPAKENADASDDTPPAPAPKPKKPAAEAAAKPHAGITPSRPTDSVAEAQKYIYGRGGVTQDCERGMRLLKPAAAEANPKAMVEMGALYSAGLCTPHDLPTAYRWFAMALRKEPDNQPVQADLQKLWGEMTPPERQLAIKLSH